MRSLIIGAAALLAVAAPGVAAAQTGYADVSYSNINLDFGGPDQDADGFGIGGVVAFDAHALGVQLGARYSNLEADGGGDADAFGADAHLFKRSDRWQLGAGAGLNNVDSGGSDGTEWTVALEGLYFMDRTTLGAALSYSDADDADVQTVALDGEIRYFINDNFRIDGGVGFGQLEGNGGGDVDLTSIGVGAEYQLAAAPVSVFGGYSHSTFDGGGGGDADTDAITVGARWNFGGTLFERDRSGANLRSLRGGFARLFGL